MMNITSIKTVSKTDASVALSSEIDAFIASGGTITKVRSHRAHGLVKEKMRTKVRMGKNGREEGTGLETFAVAVGVGGRK